ncbi:MAG: DUF4968 domain-containing protein [Rhodothermaceae bacterium]|nr:DUF4968 domain-containing protein [Rhodothermaceae bacterium]
MKDPQGFTTLGAITAVEHDKATVTLHCGEARLRLLLLTDDVVRLRVAPPGASFGRDFSYALDPGTTWHGPSALTVEENDAIVRIQTGALTIQTEKTTCRLQILDATGRILFADEAGPAWENAGSNGTDTVSHVALSARLRPGERLFGLGDKTVTLDRRGHRFALWNTDAFEYQRGTDPLYKSIPFLLSLHDGAACGLFVDTTQRMTVDLGAEANDRLRVEAPGSALDYYVLAGATPLAVLQQFARLTGRTPMLPKWALGYHQCRYSYRNEGEIREVARELRARRIPCDALYFDIHYMDGFRVFTWDRDAFPDPAGLIADLKQDGFQSIVIIDPGVKADDPAYGIARAGHAHDAYIKQPDGSPYTGKVWPGACHFPDFTNPAVRDWWGPLHAELLKQGVAGVWNDMNEPAVFIEDLEEATAITMPEDLRHDYDGHPTDHAEVHNAYGMQMLRATYEGLLRLAPERRPFTITRAAYAGTQRYGTTWTGDNTSSWDHLKLAVEQCLSLSVSGTPFVGADVGGFVGTPDGELLARWTQLGALMPLFRNHTTLGTPPQEPWVFGEEVERICREAIELRYRLLPYFYTLLWEAATDGLPMLRPLALPHPADETIRREAPLGFYLGSSLLAYPVLDAGQIQMNAYLPPVPGGWYDVHTGRHHPGDGGTVVPVETPLDRLPLFVKAGSIVPFQPVLQHVEENPVEELTLHVYPTPGAFTARLYDDAGVGWAFKNGD